MGRGRGRWTVAATTQPPPSPCPLLLKLFPEISNTNFSTNIRSKTTAVGWEVGAVHAREGDLIFWPKWRLLFVINTGCPANGNTQVKFYKLTLTNPKTWPESSNWEVTMNGDISNLGSQQSQTFPIIVWQVRSLRTCGAWIEISFQMNAVSFFLHSCTLRDLRLLVRHRCPLLPLLRLRPRHSKTIHRKYLKWYNFPLSAAALPSTAYRGSKHNRV